MPGWICKIWGFIANLLGKIVDFILKVLDALVDLAVKALKAVAEVVGDLLSGSSGWLLLGAAALAVWFLAGREKKEEIVRSDGREQLPAERRPPL